MEEIKTYKGPQEGSEPIEIPKEVSEADEKELEETEVGENDDVPEEEDDENLESGE